MTRSRTPLIVPSETQTREFDAKLLLACLATERGFDTVVGSRTEIHLRIAELPRGIYLAKDIRHSSRKIFGILEKLGFPVVALDEEALLYYSRERYLASRVCEPVLHHARELFAWGPENAEAWRECPYYHGAPIHATGNPRLDLMRPELRGFFAEEAAALRDRFGRFILINTNFGTLNHFFPNLTTLLAPEQGGGAVRDVGKDFQAGLAAHRHKVFRGFVNAVPQLSRAFPDHAIVLRPHPAESHEIWREAGAGCPNFHVLHEGNVVPWLMAADAVVHNSCTTGFEAYLVGTPVLAFRPALSETFDHVLPNEVSHQATDAEMLIEMLQAATRGALAPDAAERDRRRALADRYVSALDGRLAAERIVDRLDQLEVGGSVVRPAALTRARGYMGAVIRRLGKERNARIPGHKNHPDYTRHRFPGIELDEVNRRIVRLRDLLGRFPTAHARQLGENIFEIAA